MKTVVEQIKDRLPITEVLSSYITVEQSGQQYKAKCPFHNERTASFYISPDRGLYYCFGCGAKGDIFSFVSSFEGLDFKGTLKLLADRAGVALNDYQGDRTDTDPVYEILEKTTLRYQEVLNDTPAALDYLLARGLMKETIEMFRIGYVGDEWRFVESNCKDKTSQSIAVRAGLLKKSEDKIYDRFRKRVMFPLADSSGRVIGFSGRAFPDDGDGPKYLNSPETEIFQKSKTLFGFDKAKIHIKKHNFSILVEGQMDLVMSHQAGFKNTVATSGTAVSEDAAADPFSNLSVLARISPHVFLAFDGDEAGQKAMDRAALVALSLGMNPKVVSLPQGVDPADYIRSEGAESWKERLKESKHFIAHHLERIAILETSPHVFAKTIKEKLFPFIVRVSSPMERTSYINMIAQATGMPVSDIATEISSFTAPKQNESNTIATTSGPVSTPYERLTALRKAFSSPELESLCEPLLTLSVGEIVFSAPSIPEDRLERALHTISKDYSALDESGRKRLAEELVQKITDEFLVTTRHYFSTALRQAEGNQAEEERILGILGDINKRRHTLESS